MHIACVQATLQTGFSVIFTTVHTLKSDERNGNQTTDILKKPEGLQVFREEPLCIILDRIRQYTNSPPTLDVTGESELETERNGILDEFKCVDKFFKYNFNKRTAFYQQASQRLHVQGM